MTSNHTEPQTPVSSESTNGATSIDNFELATAGCPAESPGTSISVSTTEIASKRIESVMRENEKLKRQLQHVDNLGRMVADCKQSNLQLSKENSELRERLDQLVQLQMGNRPWGERASQQQYSLRTLTSTSSNSPDHEVSDNAIGEENYDQGQRDEAFEVVDDENRNSATCAMTLSSASQNLLSMPESISHSQTKPLNQDEKGSNWIQATTNISSEQTTLGETPNKELMPADSPGQANSNPHADDDDFEPNSTAIEASAAAAYCERQANNSIPSLSQEINVFNEVLRSENPATNLEIRQLEDLVGVTNIASNQEADEQHIASIEDDVSSGSVTAQFAKLASVFARLAQRVMQTQKKARNSQAFCDALLRENDKLKSDLEAETKKASNLQRQVEEKEIEIRRLTVGGPVRKDRTPVRRSSSLTEETHVKETQENTAANDVIASITNNDVHSFVTKLQSRVKKLEGQRTEILQVNKQWHSQYNKLKDECNAKMAASKAELDELKEQITGKKQENAKRKKDIDTLLREAKKEIDLLQRQKGELAKSYAIEHGKIQKLNEKLQKMKSDLSCVESENKRLNQALEAAYSIRQSRQLSVINSLFDEQASGPVAAHQSEEYRRQHFEHLMQSGEVLPVAAQDQVTEATPGEVEDLKTRIEVLQEQVKIYREDFETERRDREKSQAEKQRLSEEMTRMRDEMRALNQQVRAHEQDFRQERREKQRLQRQLSRIQMHVSNAGNTAAGFYYDVDAPELGQPNDIFRRSNSPMRDHHRYRRAEVGDIVIQTATVPTGDTTRRYAATTRANAPPPYSQDTTRHRRRPAAAPTTRRIRDGYLEPRGYDPDPEVVYPPDGVMNQF